MLSAGTSNEISWQTQPLYCFDFKVLVIRQESLLYTVTPLSMGHRISGVRRNYVTWQVFFSIQRQMKEDHDVSSEDDQMTLGGSYQWRAPLSQ